MHAPPVAGQFSTLAGYGGRALALRRHLGDLRGESSFPSGQEEMPVEHRKPSPLARLMEQTIGKPLQDDGPLRKVREQAPALSDQEIVKILEPRVHRALHHKNSPPQYFDWFVGTVRNVLSDWRQAAQPVSVARASVSAEELEDLASAFDPCSQAYDPDTASQPKPVREGWFDQFFWRKYPRKLGRNKTRDLFVEEVPNYRTFQRVMLGLWAQHRDLDRAPEEAHGNMCPPAYHWGSGRDAGRRSLP